VRPCGTQKLTYCHSWRSLFLWRDHLDAKGGEKRRVGRRVTKPLAPAWALLLIPRLDSSASCIAVFPFARWSFYRRKAGFRSVKSRPLWEFRHELWRGVKFPAGWRPRNLSDCCVSPVFLSLPLACSMAASLRPSRGSALHAALWLVPLRSPIPLPKLAPAKSNISSDSSNTGFFRERGCP
jgi:hypothetical protein